MIIGHMCDKLAGTVDAAPNQGRRARNQLAEMDVAAGSQVQRKSGVTDDAGAWPGIVNPGKVMGVSVFLPVS